MRTMDHGNYNGRDGSIKEYHKNGQLEWRAFYRDGKKEGLWQWYHENGQLFCKGSYKEGKKEGLWQWYWDNGQLMMEEWNGAYANDTDKLHIYTRRD